MICDSTVILKRGKKNTEGEGETEELGRKTAVL